MDPLLDNYLVNIQEDTIEEIGIGMAAAVGAGIASVGMLLMRIAQVLYAASAFSRTFKEEPELTKSINNILSSGNKWIVNIYPDPTPNAFAMGGNHVYMTTGLKDMLNRREQEAVLLHEVFHNKDLHMWKNIAAESSFLYLVAYVAITATLTISGIAPVIIIAAFIMKNSINIVYNRFVGRRHEIKADEYAVRYGYGKDLVSALSKIEKLVKKAMASSKCNKFCQLERKISEALDEHPPYQKRVEIILRKSKELKSAMKSGFMAIQKFITGVFETNG